PGLGYHQTAANAQSSRERCPDMQVAQTTPSAPAAGVLSHQSFQDIQGNILAPFNKPRQLFLFLNFRNSQQHARDWLAELVDGGVITSTSPVAGTGEGCNGT